MRRRISIDIFFTLSIFSILKKLVLIGNTKVMCFESSGYMFIAVVLTPEGERERETERKRQRERERERERERDLLQ